MTDQNFRDRLYFFEKNKRDDQGANVPIANSDQSPVSGTLIESTPTGDPVAPMNEVIVQETPTGETIVYKDSVGETLVRVAPGGGLIDRPVPLDSALLDQETSEELRTRWNEIQGRFVDEPRSAVQQADALVSEVVEKITQMFVSEHGSLESQWKQGNDISTEDLRMALQHYRVFFNRLVMQIPA